MSSLPIMCCFLQLCRSTGKYHKFQWLKEHMYACMEMYLGYMNAHCQLVLSVHNWLLLQLSQVYATVLALLLEACICIHLIADLFPVFIASPGVDFSFTVGTKLNFRDVHTSQSLSSNSIVIPITDDYIVEQTEFFTCSFQEVSNVQVIFPSQVTIEICDDDGEYIIITPCSLSFAVHACDVE